MKTAELQAMNVRINIEYDYLTACPKNKIFPLSPKVNKWKTETVADLHSKILDAALNPNFFIVMQYSANLGAPLPPTLDNLWSAAEKNTKYEHSKIHSLWIKIEDAFLLAWNSECGLFTRDSQETTFLIGAFPLQSNQCLVLLHISR